MTLADEDNESILTDNAKRVIQGDVVTQVTQPGGQLCKQCKRHHLMTKFYINPSFDTLWSNMQIIQVAPSGGQIRNLCMWCHLVAKFATYDSLAMLLANLVRVTESISGSVVPLAMF